MAAVAAAVAGPQRCWGCDGRRQGSLWGRDRGLATRFATCAAPPYNPWAGKSAECSGSFAQGGGVGFVVGGAGGAGRGCGAGVGLGGGTGAGRPLCTALWGRGSPAADVACPLVAAAPSSAPDSPTYCPAPSVHPLRPAPRLRSWVVGHRVSGH